MSARASRTLVEGWIVTVTAPNGREADLSLDGGETTAYFLTELSARVAARRTVARAHRWRVRYAWGYYPKGIAPKPGTLAEPAAPWWQNDGPTWWTRCDRDIPLPGFGPPKEASLADIIHQGRNILESYKAEIAAARKKIAVSAYGARRNGRRAA